jgi:protein-tyrosine phosphatase
MVTELKILTNIANYFKEIQPISETEGFDECLYIVPDDDFKFVEFIFYFYNDITDENYELFIDFLEKNGFKDSKIKYIENKIEISINISKKDIRKYSERVEIYNKTKKYNISL